MKYYLATTGISEIWDCEKELLLLGPWCLIGNKNKLEQGYILVPSPWKPTIKIKEAADHCYRTYLDLLPLITEQLNHLHNVSYPLRYWQVLVGPWLLLFIKVFYDRYKRIEHALELFPDSYTHVLSMKNCDLSSVDTFDFFAGKVDDDNYNLRLFSIVNYELNPDNVVELDIPAKPGVYGFKYESNCKTKIFNLFTRNFLAKGDILLTEMYHLRNLDKLLIRLRSRYNKVGFIDFWETYNPSNISLNRELRNRIKLIGAKDRFQLLLYKNLADALPLCYVEGYRSFVDALDTIKVNEPKAVGSAIGWYFNEMFKFFAAKQTLNGVKLIDFQHGGGYETYLSILSESLSMEKDFFYVWGRKSSVMKRADDKIRYLPNPHLSRLKDTYSSQNNYILFIGVSFPRYQYRFSTFIQPEDMLKYHDDKRIFLQNLTKSIKQNLVYRPYHEFGWGETDVIKQEYPGIKFLIKGNLANYMKKVKLVVIDHPHTAFIEALVINVPSVFYWDHDVYLMREEAESYFELLREAGVIYRDPVSAAKKVNEIYDSAYQWWLGDKIQNARWEFCRRYAADEKNWARAWVKELVGLVTE